jgi:acrylyl-CoA reductase (NADPH)
MGATFRAILVSRDADKKQTVTVTELSEADLMPGDVTVAVEATTVNFKDGLAITGRSPVIRHWPMVPGIDFAGTVAASQSADYKEGDKVLLNGWGTGETHWGAYAGMARVKSDWLIPLPEGLTASQAMGIGTAGYTAMLAVMALERHGLSANHGAAVVTGASGGVGSIAISLLSKIGWHVIASTGRTEEADFLKKLGAAEIIDREELAQPGRPLAAERWAAGVDAVGSVTLANLLAQTRYGGAVAACGLAQGFDLPATVMPFILRSVSLLGIDSVMAPTSRRLEAWNRLARELDIAKLDALTNTISFDEIIPTAHAILDGTIRGRVIVDMTR